MSRGQQSVQPLRLPLAREFLLHSIRTAFSSSHSCKEERGARLPSTTPCPPPTSSRSTPPLASSPSPRPPRLP